MLAKSVRKPAASRYQLDPAEQKQRHATGNALDAGIRWKSSEHQGPSGSMSKQTRVLRRRGPGEAVGRETRSRNDQPTAYKRCEIIDQQRQTNQEVEDDARSDTGRSVLLQPTAALRKSD